MKRTFGEMRARAFCHATESPEKVRLALANIVGEAEVQESVAEGHHGNPIIVMSATSKDRLGTEALLSRLREPVLRDLSENLPSRIDGACNLYLRFDKQAAFAGELVLSIGEDVVAIRTRVNAFPARKGLALELASEALELLSRRSAD